MAPRRPTSYGTTRAGGPHRAKCRYTGSLLIGETAASQRLAGRSPAPERSLTVADPPATTTAERHDSEGLRLLGGHGYGVATCLGCDSRRTAITRQRDTDLAPNPDNWISSGALDGTTIVAIPYSGPLNGTERYQMSPGPPGGSRRITSPTADGPASMSHIEPLDRPMRLSGSCDRKWGRLPAHRSLRGLWRHISGRTQRNRRCG